MRDIVVHRSGQRVDLQEPTPGDEQLLREIHARRAEPGELRCERHGGDLYLQLRPPGVMVACHWPNSGLSSHPVALMSEEHKVQVEYIARAVEREGLTADRERTLATHVRPDLVVSRTAFEVQRSGITPMLAKARTTKAVRGGMDVSLWTSDKPSGAEPLWLRQGAVPSVRIHAADWKGLPRPGAATVEGGLSQFIPERCSGGHDRRCILKSGRCSGWRLRREPILGVTLDQLSVWTVIGGYVPATVAGSTHMVTAAAANQFELAWAVPRTAQRPARPEDAARIACRSDASPTCCGHRRAGHSSQPLLPECMLCPRSATYWRFGCR